MVSRECLPKTFFVAIAGARGTVQSILSHVPLYWLFDTDPYDDLGVS